MFDVVIIIIIIIIEEYNAVYDVIAFASAFEQTGYPNNTEINSSKEMSCENAAKFKSYVVADCTQSHR